MIITNNSDISLALAVWLLHDEYDYLTADNYISATTLMKPLRQIVLASRIPANEQTMDVEDLIATSLGKALHHSIERAWTLGYKESLQKLGYPPHVISRTLVNPDPNDIKPDSIVIWVEQRALRKFRGFTIGGKFDLVTEGILQDTKTTSAYTWLYGDKDEEYIKQMSIYRWLHPDKVTEDYTRINFIFTDWQKLQARSNPDYPQKRVLHKDFELWPMEQTENWISNKLALIQQYRTAPERQIPECTDEELWMSDPKFKYYSDPNKTSGRSTKNFDSPSEAKKFMMEKGNKGVIITIPGEPARCGYCPAFNICTQKDRYFKHD